MSPTQRPRPKVIRTTSKGETAMQCAGFTSPKAHTDAIRSFREVLS